MHGTDPHSDATLILEWLRADGIAAAALRREVAAFALRTASPGRTVLDVGCGSMPYRKLFVSRGARYLGADIAGTPDLLIDPSGHLAMESASIDVVVSFQVLEHVRDVASHLATLRRVLRPEGRLFLSTHGTWPYHPHPSDFWRWTRDGLRTVLGDAGFRCDRIASLCGPAAWIPMFPMLSLKSALGRAWPVAAPLNGLVNVAAVVADRLTPASIRDENAAIFAVDASVQL